MRETHPLTWGTWPTLEMLQKLHLPEAHASSWSWGGNLVSHLFGAQWCNSDWKRYKASSLKIHYEKQVIEKHIKDVSVVSLKLMFTAVIKSRSSTQIYINANFFFFFWLSRNGRRELRKYEGRERRCWDKQKGTQPWGYINSATKLRHPSVPKNHFGKHLSSILKYSLVPKQSVCRLLLTRKHLLLLE